jgi:Cytochrome c3
MTLRRKWAAIPGLAALAAVAIILSAYSGASSPQGRKPMQPINFPHPAHVRTLGMNCVYCHFAANKSPDPGLPAVGTCMGCHTIIGPTRPKSDLGPARTSTEIQKLQAFAARSQPIPWIRIHKLPEYVHFPHMRHVNAGVTCQQCHGQIQNMPVVAQANSLNMGWCLDCHRMGYNLAQGLEAAGVTPTAEQIATPPKKARYDCSVCHF